MEGDVFMRTHSSSIKMDESHGGLNNFQSQVKVSQYDAVEPKVEPIEEFMFCGEYVNEIPDTLSDSRIPLTEGITGSNPLKDVKLELKDCLQDLVAPESTIRSIKTEPDEYILDHSLDTGPAYDENAAGCNTDTKIIQHQQWNNVSPNKRHTRLLTSQSNLKQETVTTPPPRNKRKKKVSYEEKSTSSSESDNDDSYNPKRRFEVSRSQTKKKARKSVEYSGNAVHHEKSKNKKIQVANPEKEVDCQLWSCCDKQFEHFRSYQRHRGQQHNIEELKCSICTEKSFTSEAELEKHYVDSHGDSFHCLDCRKIFGVKSSYFEHKATCNESMAVCSEILDFIQDFVVTRKKVKVKENSTFRLSCCNSIFRNFENFMVHKFSDHKIDSLTCGLCLCVNESETQLRSHYQMLHFPKLWEKLELEACDVMEEGTAATNSSNIPEDRDTDEESTEMDGMDAGDVASTKREECTASHNGILCQCSNCKRLTEGRKRMSKYTTRTSKENVKLKKFSCDKCHRTFDFKNSLNNHIKTHQGRKYLCDMCKKSFVFKNDLKRHILSKHPVNTVTCEICNNSLSSHDVKRRHMREMHFQKNKKKCELCHKTLSRNGYRVHYKQFHLRNVEYICGYCNRVYYDKSLLATHIESKHIHSESHSCSICGHICGSKTGLFKHKASKHSTNEYFCEVCGKAFKVKLRLKIHMVVHSDECPYVCQACGKRFKRLNNLDQHQYTHSDVRPFHCDICGQTFRLRTHVKQHMAVHGLVPNFKCPICDKAFARKTELKSHMSSH